MSGEISWWFWFVFPWGLAVLSIFSYACWPSGFRLWKSVCQVLHIVLIVFFFFDVLWVVYKCWILCCCSVTKLCPVLCNLVDYSKPAFPVFIISWSLLKLMSTESVMLSNHLILCRPLLLLPSIFPSIRVFPSESVLHIGWPKYWSFTFSLSPSNVYSRLISFRINWFDLLAVQGI